MLRKLFAVRSSRSPQTTNSRRLELEPLEDRIPPASAIGGMSPGPYASGGSFAYGPGSSIVTTPGYPVSFPQIYGSLGYSPEAYALSVLGAGLPAGLYPYNPTDNVANDQISSNPTGVFGPSAGSMQLLGQMEQVVGTLASLAVMQTNNPQQVFNLAVDEFFAATDNFALLQGQATGANTSSIQSDLATHQSAIQNNPVDHTTIGQMLGTAVYDTALYMLAVNQGGV